MAATHAHQIRGRVHHPVHRVRKRVGQHQRHGAGHGDFRQRDAIPSGHTGGHGPRTGRGQRVQRTPAGRGPGSGISRRSHQMRETPSDAHRVSDDRTQSYFTRMSNGDVFLGYYL